MCLIHNSAPDCAKPIADLQQKRTQAQLLIYTRLASSEKKIVLKKGLKSMGRECWGGLFTMPYVTFKQQVQTAERRQRKR